MNVSVFKFNEYWSTGLNELYRGSALCNVQKYFHEYYTI